MVTLRMPYEKVRKLKKKKVKVPKISKEEQKEIDLKELQERRQDLLNEIHDFVRANSATYKILPLFDGLYAVVLKYYNLNVREEIVMPPTSFQGDAMRGKDIIVYKDKTNQDYARLIILDYAVNRDVFYSDDLDDRGMRWDDAVAQYMPKFFAGGCRLCKVYNIGDVRNVLEYA